MASFWIGAETKNKNMKIAVSLIASLFVLGMSVQAQSLKDLKSKAEKTINKSSKGDLGSAEISAGLKEALTLGVEMGVDQLSKPGGYMNDLEVKIPLPDEAKVVEQTLRNMGQDKLVDDAIESLNRAAENAASEAKDLFVAAIKSMTVQDAAGILKGADNAATVYLDKATRAGLEAKFQPIIAKSLQKVDATTYWNTLFTNYNRLPMVQDVNPDLEKYTTDKAIDGLFVQIAKEEKAIRENPSARVTDTLKKVFGK